MPLIGSISGKRSIDKLRALSDIQPSKSEMEFVVDGDKLELQMPEQYGKMYYSQPAVEHFAAADNGEAYVDNEILAVANSGVSREAVTAAAEHIGADIVGEITITGDYQLRLRESLSYDELNELCQELCADPAISDAYPDWLNVTASDDVSMYQNQVDAFSYGAEVQSDAAANSVDKDDYPLYDMKGISWDKELIHCYRAWKYVQSVPVTPVRVGVIDGCFDSKHENVHFANIFPQIEDCPSDLYHGTHVAGILAGNSSKGVTGVYPYGSQGYLYGYANNKLLTTEKDPSEGGWHLFSCNMGWLMSVATLAVQNVKVINISQGLSWYSDRKEYPYAYQRIKKRLDEMGKKLKSKDENEAVKAMFSDPANFDPWVKEAQKVGAFYQRLLDAGYDFLLVSAAGNLGVLDYSTADGLTTLNYPRPLPLPYESRYNSTLNMISETEYPAVYQRILVVGAVEPRPDTAEEKGTVPMIAGYSNAGTRVDLFAPGGKMIKAEKHNEDYKNAAYGKMILSSVPGNQYDYYSGTSMAAPEAAGAAALAWSVNPNLSGAQVKKLLCDTAQYGCIYNNNEIGYDGLIGKINYSNNYRLLDVEKAVRRASEISGEGSSKDMRYGAFVGRVQWKEPKKFFWQDDKYRYLEGASIVVVRRDGTETGKRYFAQTGANGTFCVVVPPGEYSVRYGLWVDEKYKGKEIFDLKVSAQQTVDLNTLTLCAEDDSADIVAYQAVFDNETDDASDETAVPDDSTPEVFKDHLDDFMKATGFGRLPKAWMRYRGHIYAIYDHASSGNAKWWSVLFRQNPYPVSIESADEQGALEQLLVYGEKEAYVTGGNIAKIETTELYWAIKDGAVRNPDPYVHFTNDYVFEANSISGDFVYLYRGSGPDDPEFGLWKVQHEPLKTILPQYYLKDYGYIMEWKTES